MLKTALRNACYHLFFIQMSHQYAAEIVLSTQVPPLQTEVYLSHLILITFSNTLERCPSSCQICNSHKRSRSFPNLCHNWEADIWMLSSIHGISCLPSVFFKLVGLLQFMYAERKSKFALVIAVDTVIGGGSDFDILWWVYILTVWLNK